MILYFLFYNDHKALQYLGSQHKLNQRHMKWVEYLQSFTFMIKNKLKTWKVGYRVMKDLKNTSGLAWNEETQTMDAEDSMWDELLKVG